MVTSEAQFSVGSSLSSKAIAGIALLATFTIFITWRARILEMTLADENGRPQLVAKLAPDFSAPTLDGRTVSLAGFRGQKQVVVTFWASWCGPCRLEMPALVKFYQNNHHDSSDFEILAISVDQDRKAAADFATADELNFPVLLDPASKIADSFKVEGIPATFVIDKNGTVTYGRVGYDMATEYQLARQLGIDESKVLKGP